jgi:chromosome segregation ATPase
MLIDFFLFSFKHAEVAFKAATRAKAVVQAESEKSAVVIRSRASSAIALAKQRAVFYVSFHVVATAFQQANAAIASLNTTADNISRTQQKLEAFVAQHSSELARKTELENALKEAESQHAAAQQTAINAQAKVQQSEQRLPQITSSLVTARAQFEAHQTDMVSHAMELNKVEEEVKTLTDAVKKEEAMVKAAADKEQKFRSYLELLDRYTGAHSLDLDAEIAAKQAEIEKAKAEVEAEALASKDVLDEQRSVQNHVLDEMVALIRNSQATLQQKVTSAEQGLQQLLGLQRLLQKSTSDFAAMRYALFVLMHCFLTFYLFFSVR